MEKEKEKIEADGLSVSRRGGAECVAKKRRG
jgi:hypothetical protein